MIREEEDDTTQEVRALVLLQLKNEKVITAKQLRDAMIPITDEWTEGVNAGLEWAVRIINRDKSAT